ncbi:MAG: T9SS type A sorting domain-containing protein [Saprospiraceae bacterium]|nr:T9SS type A sorting domain-containing protein [Saprospiraceae bacterium]
MKVSLLIASLFISSFYINAQNTPINFEAGGFGANWTWTVFENGTNPPLEIVANPDMSGMNTSTTVAKFTALQAGAPYAGCESKQGVDLGNYRLSNANSIITIMVWKNVISNVGIKLVTTSLGALPEIKKPNTLINQWEKITFDFSGYINNAIYAVEDVNQMVVFPDFVSRNADRVIFFDNITIGDGSTSAVNGTTSHTLHLGPNPTKDILCNHSEYILEQVKIHDFTGREVLTIAQVPVGETMDVSTLPEGIYIVNSLVGGKKKYTRLVKY